MTSLGAILWSLLYPISYAWCDKWVSRKTPKIIRHQVLNLMFSVGPLKVGRLKLGMCADPIQVLLNWSKLWTSFWLGVFKNCNFWSGFGLTFLYALILKYIWCLKFLKTSKIQQPSVAANFLSCTNCAKFCFSIPRYLWYTITFVLCQTHTLYYFIKCPILIVLCILRCVDPYYIICTDFY